MKSVIPIQLGANRAAMMQQRVRAVTQVRAHGTHKIPDATRGIQVQPAKGGALITWNLPTRYDDVTGYRIYVGSEKNLAIQLRDRGTRQQFVALAAGDTPPNNNIFVSAVNGFREGPKVHLQAAALPDTDPAPSATTIPSKDFQNVFSGGLDKTQSGQPSGKLFP